MKLIALLMLFAGVASAQDSTKTKKDSVAVTHWDYTVTNEKFYTRVEVDTVVDVDTVSVPTVATGVDSTKKGDTTFYAFWHTGKIVDSTKFNVASSGGTPTAKLFGPMRLYDEGLSYVFTGSSGEASGGNPQFLLDNIAIARRTGKPFIANLPCGSHSSITGGRCMKQNADGVWVYSRENFLAALRAFDRPDVKAAVEAAVRDGLIIGFNLMDEPWVSGGDDGAGTIVPNSWGPPGTVTKAEVDLLCTEAKRIFPVGAMGTSDHLTAWEPSKNRLKCDFGIFQYSHRFGDVTTWRQSTLARAARGGYDVVYSFNILNGGTQDKDDGTWDCRTQGGIKGSRKPNCAFTPTQMVNVTTVLGDAGKGILAFWRFDALFARADWKTAFNEMARIQSARQPKPITRRPS